MIAGSCASALIAARAILVAILVASLFSYVALAINHVSTDLFSFLINACGATMLIVYLLLSFSQLNLRAKIER
mgnify:CR=1 FL=1